MQQGITKELITKELKRGGGKGEVGGRGGGEGEQGNHYLGLIFCMAIQLSFIPG